MEELAIKMVVIPFFGHRKSAKLYISQCCCRHLLLVPVSLQSLQCDRNFKIHRNLEGLFSLILNQVNIQVEFTPVVGLRVETHHTTSNTLLL